MPSMLPLPQSLPKECRKAEKILKSFMETSRGGLDGVRPLLVVPALPRLTYTFPPIALGDTAGRPEQG